MLILSFLLLLILLLKLRWNHIYGAKSHYSTDPADADSVLGTSEGISIVSQHRPNGRGVHGLLTTAR